MTDSTMKVPVDGVAMTAIGVAVIRARESERPDRLYDDPQAAACHRHVVVSDLRDDWQTPLLAAGFHPNVPTYWVDEGSLGYLNQDWNQRVVRTLTGLSAPGSRFGAARYVVDPDAPQYRDLRRLVAGDEAPAPITPPQDFDVQSWLDSLGWTTEFRTWNDMTAHLDRPVGPLDPRIGNIAAVRR